MIPPERPEVMDVKTANMSEFPVWLRDCAKPAARGNAAVTVASAFAARKYLENVKFIKNQKVADLIGTPISGVGGVGGLSGSLASEGAIVKVAGMTQLDIRTRAPSRDRSQRDDSPRGNAGRWPLPSRHAAG